MCKTFLHICTLECFFQILPKLSQTVVLPFHWHCCICKVCVWKLQLCDPFICGLLLWNQNMDWKQQRQAVDICPRKESLCLRYRSVQMTCIKLYVMSALMRSLWHEILTSGKFIPYILKVSRDCRLSFLLFFRVAITSHWLRRHSSFLKYCRLKIDSLECIVQCFQTPRNS